MDFEKGFTMQNDDLANECIAYLMTVVRGQDLPHELKIAAARFALEFVGAKPHSRTDVGISTHGSNQ